MPSPLEPKGDTSRPDAGAWLSLAASGFRPFFLLAVLFAALAVPMWVLILLGKVRPSAYLDAANWHAHEMLFGFVVAVVAGFLLTAVRNWTQRETLTGAPLLALAALWMAGRVAMLCVDRMPRGLPALIDLCFLPLLSLALARPLFLARSYRNFVMLGIVTLWLVANAGMHLDALGVLPSGFARRAALVSVDLAVLMISVVAGRVFPMFTRNATGVASIRSVPAIDGLALGGLTVLVAADLFVPDSSVAALVAGLADGRSGGLAHARNDGARFPGSHGAAARGTAWHGACLRGCQRGRVRTRHRTSVRAGLVLAELGYRERAVELRLSLLPRRVHADPASAAE
jgi:uncharacterized protein involved in response to NO